MSLDAIDNFGGIDADGDALLRACFTNHESYVSARDMSKFLVLGRKGAGKTAIYKQLILTNEPDTFSYGYSFDDYPWHHHDLQAEVGVPEERRYIHSWKYLILMGLSKILLNYDQSQPWSVSVMDSIGALENFVVDSYGSRDPDYSQLFSPGKELRFKGGLNLKFAQIQAERVSIEDLPVHIQAINRAVQDHVLAALNPNNNYYICFDQLDLGFSTVDEKYGQRLTGLLIAARDLFVAAKEAGKRFNPVIFLRDDIYQDLQFEDKNKITENYSTRLHWEVEGPGLTLKQLMERRFTEVLGNGTAVTWEQVFDESPETRMPGRQSKYQHICDRTLLRPRDMIKFCNEILKEHRRDEDGSPLFGNPAIHAARDPYSDYLLNEIDDEIAKHVPMYKDYLEVLKIVGSEKFEFTAFADVFDQREELAGHSPMDALAELFAFSVISYLRPGGRGGGSEYVWRYKDPRARFDSNIDSFRVHPGFKEVLGLTR
ncbi:P-loop ATPase, Sll1717 family [Nocardioides silvaticus]|nr:hypothetical protein [Nocardioides silvaticus]